MNLSFLLITQREEAQWSLTLRQALSPLGKLHVVSKEEAAQVVAQNFYDLVIMDAGAISDFATLVSYLREQRPEMQIIVATASPTWQRAREALQAGAADYIRKSLDEEELCSKIKAVLKL